MLEQIKGYADYAKFRIGNVLMDNTGLSATDMLNSLVSFLCTVVSIIGGAILLFGIVQLGLAIKSHDASQRTQGFLAVAGGIIIACAPWVLKSIFGWGA